MFFSKPESFKPLKIDRLASNTYKAAASPIQPRRSRSSPFALRPKLLRSHARQPPPAKICKTERLRQIIVRARLKIPSIRLLPPFAPSTSGLNIGLRVAQFPRTANRLPGRIRPKPARRTRAFPSVNFFSALSPFSYTSTE